MQSGKQLVTLKTSAVGSLALTAKLEDVTGVILSIVPSWQMVVGLPTAPAYADK